MAFDRNKVQELYPEAMMYEAMLIHQSTDSSLQKACSSGEYFGQLKKDGYWYQYEKHENHTYLFSRSASKKTGLQAEKLANVPHIAAALDCLPPHTILIGEIYYPQKTSKGVTEIMGCLADKAIIRQKSGWGQIHYYLHDIIMYDNINFVTAKVDNELRYKILQKIFYLHHLDQYDFLELAEVWEDNLYERIGNALSAGEEGMVLKKKDGIYEPGKRPQANLKAKKVDFADVIITGFEVPTKEYYGKELESWGFNITEDGRRLQGTYHDLMAMGYNPIPVTKPWYYQWYNARINIGAYDDDDNLVTIGTIHSGITDEMKEDMTLHEEKYLNHVCAIQMMEKDPIAKTVRHGFFRGLREDKNAEDCLISDIF